jgi:hypothetical protein
MVAEGSAAPTGFSQSSFRLAPGEGSGEIVVTGAYTHPFAPGSRRGMDGEAARLGAAGMQYVDPALYIQPSMRGPRFELAALGGGMESAPFLAHVALNWQF